MTQSDRTYDVAAYVWPAYTGNEPRTRMFWPEGNGEWETVRKATAKFPGHQWPRRPLWGYGNEADPRVMEMQIDAAADHGVNVFISTNVDRDYATILQDVVREWERIGAEFSIPYFPHVSVGWDNNPRFQNFRPGVVKNNTPEQIQKALELARDYADRHPAQAPLITVNRWNEWTETSYLQPDDIYGYGYIEAVRAVFAEEDHHTKCI